MASDLDELRAWLAGLVDSPEALFLTPVVRALLEERDALAAEVAKLTAVRDTQEAALARWRDAAVQAERLTSWGIDKARAVAAERDAYRKAKAENDERFMIERDEARAEVAKLTEERDEAKRALGDVEGAVLARTYGRFNALAAEAAAAIGRAGEAETEVARLRAVLAEPSEEEAERLALLMVPHTGIESRGAVRAVLAELRKLAEVPRGE